MCSRCPALCNLCCHGFLCAGHNNNNRTINVNGNVNNGNNQLSVSAGGGNGGQTLPASMSRSMIEPEFLSKPTHIQQTNSCGNDSPTCAAMTNGNHFHQLRMNGHARLSIPPQSIVLFSVFAGLCMRSLNALWGLLSSMGM